MNPKDIIEYFESKVIDCSDFSHRPDQGKKAFFVIDDPYDFEEFDEALRNCASFPAVLCEMVQGRMDDNAGTDTNTVSISFMVLNAKSRHKSASDIRSGCYQSGMKLLKAIRADNRLERIPGHSVTVEMNSNYQPVGPIATEYIGYQFDLTFVVSGGFCG